MNPYTISGEIRTSLTFNTVSVQIKPAVSTRAVNPVFYPDTLTIGSVSSPFTTYAANAALGSQHDKYKDWSITDHYKISSREEIYPTLVTVREKIDSADFTGMKDTEIYTYIEDCYKEAFGDEFYMARALAVDGPGTTGQSFGQIYENFKSDLYWQFGIDSQPSDINRRRLYGDMSIREIQDIIRAKYPPTNKMTNRDLCLFLYELSSVGANGGLGYGGRHGHKKGMQWENELDKSADYAIDVLAGNWNISQKSAGSPNIYSQEKKESIIRFFNVPVGPDGLFISNRYREWLDAVQDLSINIKYQFTPPDLITEFMNRLDEHYNSLEEISDQRDAITINTDDNPITEIKQRYQIITD